MRICPQLRSADAKEMRRQSELAFTMVEIALAIGVIGFALVAIIGILPAGMNVQKDNREDTVISQDAPYFLDAIRNGAPANNGAFVNNNGYLVTANNYELAQSMDFLTNYVQKIRFDYWGEANGSGVVSITNTIIYSNFTSGAEIIGLLSTPQNNYNSLYFASNYFDITATVRALSGPATAQQGGGLNSFMAFTYNLEVMITPFNSVAPDSTNWNNLNYPSNSPDYNIRYNRWMEVVGGGQNNSYNYLGPGSKPANGALQYNLFDVRLRFSWPVLQNGNVGPGRQTYRTMVAAPMSRVVPFANAANNWWFFQPQTYANSRPQGL